MKPALCILVLLLLAVPVAAQENFTGCTVYERTVEFSPGQTSLVFHLVDGYPTRVALYDGTRNYFAMPPSRLTTGIGSTGADDWDEFTYHARIYDDLETGTYTAVFAGLSGGFVYGYEIEANTTTTVTIECM